MSGEFINAILERLYPDLSIIIDERCVVSIDDYLSVQKDVNGAILKTRIKDKISMQTYEEYGHCSDTFRYLVTDMLKERFTAFANVRKRNLYAKDGAIPFFNPDTECTYTDSVLYIIPDIEGRTVILNGKLCGDNWHIVSAVLTESVMGHERIKELCRDVSCRNIIFETSRAYYPMVRELREEIDTEIGVKKESDELTKRISATSGYVKEMLRFNPMLAESDEDYARFINSLLDYSGNADNIHASAAVSGFINFVLKRNS